jgi:hypothetical protein
MLVCKVHVYSHTHTLIWWLHYKYMPHALKHVLHFLLKRIVSMTYGVSCVYCCALLCSILFCCPLVSCQIFQGTCSQHTGIGHDCFLLSPCLLSIYIYLPILQACILFGLCYLWFEDIMIFWNIRNHSCNKTVSHLRKPGTSTCLQRKLQILKNFYKLK